MPETENLLLTGASVEISAAAKMPTINVLAYSGGLMSVPGWGTVVIDLAGLDLSTPQVSLLADHDASLKGIVGHGQAVVRDGKLLVMGTLADATEAAKQIIALAKTGFAFQASVGVSPTETKRIDSFQKIECNGRIIKAPKSGCLLVTAGLLREVSIVVVGADPGTTVSISASQKGTAMPDAVLETEDAPVMTAAQIREEAAAETKRIAMIRSVCAGEHREIEGVVARRHLRVPLAAGQPVPSNQRLRVRYTRRARAGKPSVAPGAQPTQRCTGGASGTHRFPNVFKCRSTVPHRQAADDAPRDHTRSCGSRPATASHVPTVRRDSSPMVPSPASLEPAGGRRLREASTNCRSVCKADARDPQLAA